MKLFWIVALLLAGLTRAQPQTPAKRILGSAVVEGFVGGESHDAYVLKAIKGQTLTLQLTWKPKDNLGSLSISRSTSFFSADPVSFGRFSNQQQRWVGQIPQTADYYLFVVAHPTADYKLWVKLQ